jgi:hypothetical protein
LPSLEPRGSSHTPILPVLRRRRGGRRWGGTDPVEMPSAGMGPAIGLCAVATVLAGVVAYGTHPVWAQFRYGLGFILLSRQLQWPFITMSLVAAVALMGTVIAGRRRAWWLIGLAPILTLFGHRFATDPTGGMAAVENPTFVAPEAADFMTNDDYVVGLTFEGKNYAYPFAALYATPAVIHAEHDKRVLVMWSAPANRALACTVTREVKARDIDIVSTPANALLMYDTSRGVFINGLTGLTTAGQRPHGFLQPVPTVKMQWWKWRVTFPDTRVMVPAGKLAAKAPRQPMQPVYPMPPAADATHDANLKVVLVGTQTPAAVQASSLGAAPLNLSADGVPVMVFRDPATSVARGFRRKIDDLSPRFKANRDPKRVGVLFVDADTNSGWNAAGVAVEAKKDFRGKRLPPVPVDDELPWAVVKYWYPQLQLVEGGTPQTVIELNGAGPGPANGAASGSATATITTKPQPTTLPATRNSTVSVKPSRAPRPAPARNKSPDPASGLSVN